MTTTRHEYSDINAPIFNSKAKGKGKGKEVVRFQDAQIPGPSTPRRPLTQNQVNPTSPLYSPHGKWEFTRGKDIEHVVSLGDMCG